MSVLTDVADHLLNSANLVRSVADGGFAVTSNMVRPGPPVPASADQSLADAVPPKAIFIAPTGGISGRGRGEPDQPTVQIGIRSDPYEFEAGHALADAVYEALHLKPPSGYFDALSFTGRPAHLNQDEQGQHLFVFNVRLKREVAES